MMLAVLAGVTVALTGVAALSLAIYLGLVADRGAHPTPLVVVAIIAIGCALVTGGYSVRDAYRSAADRHGRVVPRVVCAEDVGIGLR